MAVFNYDKARHDVSVVGGKGYQRCQLPKHSDHSWVLRTGDDAVTLRRGNNNFICGQPGHCQNNMKLHVNALIKRSRKYVAPAIRSTVTPVDSTEDRFLVVVGDQKVCASTTPPQYG
ncbi:hypothetical protein ACQ4PT_009263 [Festuca glaucescens]